MRRPFCTLCLGAVGIQLVFVFLPQVVFLPLAAFFVCLSAVLIRCGKKTFVLLLLGGMLLGGCFFLRTVGWIRRLSEEFGEKTCTLSATVEEIASSYYEGAVKAELLVTEADGRKERFRCLCVCMPFCEVGEEIEGEFTLEIPTDENFRTYYSDNIVFLAELVPDTLPQTVGVQDGIWVRLHRVRQKVSRFFRQELNGTEGAVLSAMTVGDRQDLSDGTKRAYRAAGLSHVLVVSGMHVSLLGSGLFVRKNRQRELTRRRRLAQALYGVGSAVVLTGVAGATPSLLRADTAILLGALGVFLFAPSDTLTSLGAAGLWMSAGNSFALADVGFQLSFSAVLGIVLGGWLFDKMEEEGKRRRKRKQNGKMPQRLRAIWQGGVHRLGAAVCTSAAISVVSFPVLVLQGGGVSLYALLSNVVILWTVTPILRLGIFAAVLCLFPFTRPVAKGAVRLARFPLALLNGWTEWVTGFPKAEVYFATYYPLAVFGILLLLCGLAYRKGVRPVPAILTISLLLTVAMGLGILHNRGVVSVALVGSRRSPCVVVLAEGTATVLLRGGTANQEAVEQYLEHWGEPRVRLVLDLRTKPKTLTAFSEAERHTPAEGSPYHISRWTAGAVTVELLPTKGGSLVSVLVGGRRFVLSEGEVHLGRILSVDVLLASASRPSSIRARRILTRDDGYSWLKEEESHIVFYGQKGLVYRFRPHGGAAVTERT